jgi:hypothetical protein
MFSGNSSEERELAREESSLIGFPIFSHSDDKGGGGGMPSWGKKEDALLAAALKTMQLYISKNPNAIYPADAHHGAKGSWPTLSWRAQDSITHLLSLQSLFKKNDPRFWMEWAMRDLGYSKPWPDDPETLIRNPEWRSMFPEKWAAIASRMKK